MPSRYSKWFTLVACYRRGSRKKWRSLTPGCCVGFDESPSFVACTLGGSRSPLRPHPATARPITAKTTVRRMICGKLVCMEFLLGSGTDGHLHSEVYSPCAP